MSRCSATSCAIALDAQHRDNATTHAFRRMHPPGQFRPNYTTPSAKTAARRFRSETLADVEFEKNGLVALGEADGPLGTAREPQRHTPLKPQRPDGRLPAEARADGVVQP